MIPDCLKNLFSLRSLCVGADTVPRSGLYLDDLEFFKVSSLANIADLQSAETAKQLFEQKYALAIRNVKIEIAGKLVEKGGFRLRSVVDSEQVGCFRGQKLAPSADFRGLLIKKNVRSRMAKLHIERLRLLFHTTGIVNVIITDGEFQKQYSIPVEAGIEKEVEVDYYAKHSTVRIVANNTNFSPNASVLTGSRTGCCGGVSGKYTLFEAQGIGESNKTTNYTYGITADVSLKCDTWELMCYLRDDLELPLMMRTAMEIAKEALSSDRMNSTVLHEDRNYQLLRNFEKEYNAKLTSVLISAQEGLKDFDPICLQCIQARTATRQM